MTEPQPQLALVTGGAGFVGRHLTRELLRRGYSIWIMDDLSTGLHPDTWLGEEWQRAADLRGIAVYCSGTQTVYFSEGDVISLLPAFDPVDVFLKLLGTQRLDYVFHLASVVGGRTKIEGDPIAVAIDLAIDAMFFRWAVHNKMRIGRILYASSSAAYPIHLQADGNATALKESHISFSQQLGQPDMTYGWSKLTGEYLAQIAAKHYSMSVACVRPFSGYGGDQDQTYPIPAIGRRAALREDPLIVWGSGEQGRDFVHIDDCIEAMLLAIDKISDGIGINIGSGKLTTFRRVAQLFAELAGYQPEIKPLVTKPTGVHARHADISEMKARLGWEPRISLSQGLQRVLDEQIDLSKNESERT